MDRDIGIVIPAFEPDPERIGTYIDAIHTELAPSQIHVELDVPSQAVLQSLENSPATVRCASSRRGKGAAITAGFEHLDTAVRAFVDADGSTPPSSLEAVITPVLEETATLAIGSRRHPQSNVQLHQTRIRRRLGDLFVQVARLMLPISLYDYQCGAKAIDQQLWASVRNEITSPGFAWDIELIAIAAALDATIAEVPITWADRSGSTVPILGTATEFAMGLLRARHRAQCLQGNRVRQRLDRFVSSQPLIVRDELRSHDVFSEGQ